MCPEPQLEPGKLLLSVDEGSGSLAAVRALRAAGYATWLAIYQPDAYAARSRAAAGVVEVTPPKLDVERHVRELSTAAERLGVAAVLPGTEGSLRAVTGRESLFPRGVAVGTCPPEVLRRATDKLLLGELAGEVGLDVPSTLEVHGEAPDSGEVTFPAVVKPRSSVQEAPGASLHYGEVERVDDAVELRRALAGAPGEVHLVQPYVEGTLAAI